MIPAQPKPSDSGYLSLFQVSIYDAASDPRINYSAAVRKEGVKSILVAPIPIRGNISGVLRLLTREHRRFDEKEIEFVTALAEQCGIAIENARIYEDQLCSSIFMRLLTQAWQEPDRSLAASDRDKTPIIFCGVLL